MTSALPAGTLTNFGVEERHRYWHETLSGDLPVLRLTPDYPRPPVSSFIRDVEGLDVDQSLYHQLRSFCTEKQIPLNVVLLAAFNALLHRHTGERDILVGSVAPDCLRWSGTEQPERFTNLVALRTNLAEDPDFLTLLTLTARTVEEADRHRDYPFEEALEITCAKRSNPSSAGIHNLFAFCRADVSCTDTSLDEADLADVDEHTSESDIFWIAVVHAEKLGVSCHYNAELFESATILRLLGHYQSLLRAAVSCPETTVSALKILTDAELHQLVVEWNDTKAEYPKDKCIHELFEEQVERTPDAVAVVFKEQQLTYRALNARANQLAHHLQRLGVQAETLVGLCLERSIDMIVALLGILKAAGAYVPLDPTYPKERLRFMLEDAQTAVIVTHRRFSETLPGEIAHRVCLDDDWEKIGQESREDPQSQARAENLAYVLYTSGSTGVPKGVMVEHRGLVNYLTWCIQAYPVTAGHGAPLHSSLAFDLTVTSLWAPLLTGRAVYLVDEGLGSDGLAQTLQSNTNLSLVKITPAHLQLLSQQLAPQSAAGRTRAFIIGGEELHAEHLAFWQEHAPDTDLVNEYGPTETVVGCCVYDVPRDTALQGPIPIGRPIHNTQLYILDATRQPVPIGVAGELYIGGDGVARGYLNRPELMAEKFIPDPFSPHPGARLYRTGDLARYLPDGNIAFIGRIDHQVKIRGYRIELGEVESTLNGCAGVRQSVVLAREDQPGLKHLVAYVVGMALAKASLLEQLKQRLPEYMVPTAIVFLEQLPLLPNGKLDRRALPVPQYEQLGSPGGYVAPGTGIESLIAEVWAELLRLERVGLHDDFFALGGHSLLAGQLAARLVKLCGVELPLRLIFERPTVAGLASAVERLRGAGQSAQLIAPVARTGPLPLSFAQEGLWILDQLNPGGTAYNLPVTLRMSGPLNVTALRRAFGALIERHESLRTRFTTLEGEARQIIDAAGPVAMVEHDLQALSESSAEARARELVQQEANRPFDLVRGPLLRVLLIRVAEHEHVVSINAHHIITDGRSVEVMTRELQALYGAFHSNRADPLPSLPIQYADYALWQRQRLQGPQFDALMGYWREKLAGLEPLSLPMDRPRPAQLSYRGGTEALVIPAELLGLLKALASRHSATLFMVLLSAFKLLLMRLSGQEDVAVGSPVAGRDRAELDDLIGLFLNTLVLRTDLSGDPTFEQVLARARQTALDAYAHQDMPFERLVAALNPTRELNHNPLFDVMINHIDDETSSLELPRLLVQPMRPDSTQAKFALTLYIRAHGDSVDLRLVYQSDLFSPERAGCMLDQFVGLLRQIVASPQQSIHAYSLVTPGSRTQLPDPRAAIDEPAQHSVVEQVLAWAQRSPGQVAVRTGDRHWTYAELVAQATSLAKELRLQGIGRCDVVAIVGPRGFGMVGAMLAVLMSGGAFLTIDPTLPAQRRRVMLNEARARAVCLIAQPAGSEQELGLDAAVTVLHLDFDLSPRPGLAFDAHAGVTLPMPHGDDPAYVFFTSGSTGQPKGIQGCHKGLSHFLRWQRETFAISPDDRVSQLISLTFDPLLRDVFLPLTSGAMLCVPADGDLLDTIGWLDREGVTVVHTTPTLMQSWLRDDDRTVELRHLRWLFISGEPLTDTLVKRWRLEFPGPAQLVNLYGPTETTMALCFYPIPAVVAPGIQPIGTPLPESQALVLNRAGQLCGIGETGEIILRTPFRSLGYLNLPGENARCFRPNPFRDDPSDIVYSTGDQGRYRPDGLLEIAGRVDDQVKIRGVRVEPGEVTTNLLLHGAIRECIVVAREDRDGQRQLVGYVTCKPGQSTDASALRAHLKVRLPEVFAPAAFVFLDALPQLSNGKIDRRALPAPVIEPINADRVAPRSPLEQAVADLWSEVLGFEAPSIHDDFFALGGHSLLAMRIVARVGTKFGVELPVRVLFESPTVAGLAEAIDRLKQQRSPARQRLLDLRIQQKQAQKVSAPIHRRADAIARRSGSDPVPLTHTQRRAWFLAQLDPDSTAYHEARAYRLSGPVDVAALRESLRVLISRHEILRTTYSSVGDEPMQFVHDDPAVDFEVVDLTSRLALEGAEVLSRMLAQAARAPFDLARGALLRFRVIRIDENEYVLLRVWHHILSDGWSAGVFERELSALYNGQVTDLPAQLPALPIQYADYALWQRQWLAGAVLEQQLAYWKQQLAGLATLELPIDRPRPALQSYRGTRLGITLPDAVGDGLKALGRKEGATLFMTGLAAFKVLLYRYSGTTDIAVGTPIAGRGRLELEGLIGFFANTLVLRTDLSGSPTFRQVLARVRETALGAYTHQDLPFEKLVEELAPARDPSRNPLFQVCFAVQNLPRSALTLQGLAVGRVDLPAEHAKFDLSLDLLERDGTLQASFEYCTDLFERTTIERLAGHFGVLLESILANPDQSIGTLTLMSTAERHRILVEWNDTAADYPGDRCVHQLFEEQAARTPEAVAVVFEDRPLTYGKLNARANQLAHYLIALGVRPDVLVGICLERSLELIVGLLGILKAGGAYVPLDPGYPKERLGFMLRDTQASILLTQEGLLGQLPQFDGRILCLDRDWKIIVAQPDSHPPCHATSGNLAYVIYTSGSTGRPKGVAIGHLALVNHMVWMQVRFPLTASDKVLQKTSISGDASVWELFAPFLGGAQLIMAAPGIQRSPPDLIETVRRQQITVLQVVPSMLAAMLDESGLSQCTTLRHFYCGGEVLLPEVARRFRAQSSVELINLYGPTEATIDATYFIYLTEKSQQTIPIGRPIANARIYILDRDGEPVPVGVPGELYVGGAGLARGYLNRPEPTAEKFLPDRFSAVSGARMYRTGDLARYLADGNIEYLGRIDDQVKIRGFRIELGEIEAVLAEHAAVRQAVVLAREDQPGLKRLVAYVVGEALKKESLLEQLKQRLPDYMVPTAIVFLKQLPVLPNGKLDRRALPAPEYEQLGALGGYVAPGTAIESLIAEVWGELLGLERVGVHDDFFALGGHSLLAGQLASRLVKLCAVELPLRRVFESPTVAGLAREIERLRGAGLMIQAQPIAPVAHTGPLPLSFAQQRLWFIEQLSPGTGAYNLPTVVSLRGHLQREVLRGALDTLIVRHESLRTRIATTGGEARQIIDAAGPVNLVEHDLRALGESDAAARAHELMHEEANRPFDLGRGPLLRITLLRLAEHERVLVINMHHIISDGWSAGVFEREISALYNGQVAGQPVRLPALPIQYADYALWQREWLSGAVLEQQLAYWKTQLAGLATLELPIDRPRPAVQSYRGARLEITLASAAGEGLRALGRKEGATLFMAGLAAFKVLLYRYSGTTDIAIGTPIAGRSRLELEGLIGFFANTLVLRTDLAGAPTFRQVLARVRESALGAYTHQDLPFEKLVEELAPARDLSRNPLFQVCFAVQNMTGRGLTLQGLDVGRVDLPAEHAKFDLSLDLRERDGTLQARFEYCTELFERGTIERLAAHFGVLLEALLANPDQSIDTPPLMTDAERHRILVEWNETAAAYPKDQTLAGLFEARVRRTPDAPALIQGDQTLSYAQLNARANQLAHYLCERGVGPEVPVALCLERSPDLIVGLLGIVKAGGAYVPLDADQPVERLAFLLQDSAPRLVLTQASLLGRLPAGAHQLLCLDRDWPGIAAHGTDDPPNQGTAEQRVYVMYTSGSTGTPKGVAIRQQGVIRLVIQPNYVDIGPDDTMAQISNVAFDAATFEIWGALLNGARLAILPRDTVLSPRHLAVALEANRVTCLFLSTALFNRVSSEKPDAFKALRHVLFGGEACDPDRVKAVMQAGPPARLVHVYGPTETTTFATFHVVRDNEERATIPIGRPITETQVLLLDPRGELVAPGVVGEIHIGGLGVAAGYVNRPVETRAHFVPHPFDRSGGTVLYRTGDLARWLADGALEFIGRNDDQVKIRGFRIEPAEIAAVLATHPEVRACHVLARRQPTGDLGLTAYVVVDGSGGEQPSPATLRRFLSARLPDYMLPAAFVPLASLPLTSNGKVDTRALPEPCASNALEPGGYAAPRDALERTMCQVWAEVLGVKRVGLDDNFFEIGGHSLLAAKLFARLDEAIGRSLTLGVLFSAPTVRQLADRYRDSATLVNEPARALVPLRREGTRPRLYFLPGVFGNVVGYVDFVRELGPDQPIYGLQSIGLDGRAEPFKSIEAMARHYLVEVRAHQPQGPYAFIGACFGATVAYEMARQLMAAGEVVAFLGLIAPTARGGDEADERLVQAPRVVRRAVALANLVRGRLRGYLRDMHGLSLPGRLRYLVRKVQSLSATVMQPHGLKGAQRELNQLEVYRANLHALDSYARRPLDGVLFAFEILETAAAGLVANRLPIDWEAYWQGPLKWHVLPGRDSGDMLAGANAAVVATLLTERLRAAFEQSVSAASAAPARQTDASA